LIERVAGEVTAGLSVGITPDLARLGHIVYVEAEVGAGEVGSIGVESGVLNHQAVPQQILEEGREKTLGDGLGIELLGSERQTVVKVVPVDNKQSALS
jgi:hypothetical protein